LLLAFCTLYPFLLCGGILISLFSGDCFFLIGVANMFAVYAFAPLLLLLPVAVIGRRPAIWTGLALCGLVFAWQWGPLFSPGRLSGEPTSNSEDTLSVMTYNVLAYHEFNDPVIEVMRKEKPDVVFLQEMNTNLAGAIERELATLYPFQILWAQDSPAGMGLISKYPLTAIDDGAAHFGGDLNGTWVGGPLAAQMDWRGQRVTLVNFHMFPTNSLLPDGGLRRHFAIREAQAAVLAAFARQARPAILGGDANAAPQSGAYRVLSDELEDAWMQAGLGLGHTFPGSDTPGGHCPRIGPILSPMWLIRIDYLWYTSEWQALEARTAAFDGVSDHRGVVAVLHLR
jgi:endonuclease/exonuclease/phosphatase (EEP) superfamily protein YafD